MSMAIMKIILYNNNNNEIMAIIIMTMANVILM
jgi:hypothetical protein